MSISGGDAPQPLPLTSSSKVARQILRHKFGIKIGNEKAAYPGHMKVLVYQNYL